MQEETVVLQVDIFPEEVWEVILGKLEDSRDILRTFEAFPSLRDRVLKNKYWWLIDQVIPHICPWITRNELLTCRLVCKKWCHGVDNYLENHPIRRAYDHDRRITGQLWIPEGSPKYEFYNCTSRAYQNNEDHWKMSSSYFKDGNIRRIERFCRCIASHPPNRNPFIGRSVTLYDWSITCLGSRSRVYQSEFRTEALKFLQKYRDHVWFLTVEFEGNHGHPMCFYENLFQLLSYFPNLKSLKIMTYATFYCGWDSELETFLQTQSIPNLPQLETLNITCDSYSRKIPSCLVDFFIKSYSGQIRKLFVNMSQYREFYDTSFPELTELSMYGYEKVGALDCVLNYMQAPKLWRFEMDFPENYCHETLYEVLVVKLYRFPQITTLVVVPQRNTRNRRSSPEHYKHDEETDECYGPLDPIIVPSVKSLILYCGLFKLKKGFLESFPNLEHLKVCLVNSFLFYNRELMCRDDPDLWKFPLHKLKAFSIEGEAAAGSLCYTRSYGNVFTRTGSLSWKFQKITIPNSPYIAFARLFTDNGPG